ncbi:hypothetical protein [Arabidopsis thaliana]|nr:hypothetical protein [Arabidopsis thaliana]CAB78906.1 hypothetical protein [Arabidopsis thaliana]
MSKVVYEGWMVRYGRRKIGRSYIHMRYFVLEPRLLAYYKKKPQDYQVPIKTMLIDGNCRVEDRGLKTHHGHMVYVLSVYNKKEKSHRITMAAFNIQEALMWKEKIESVIDQHQESQVPNGQQYVSFEYKSGMDTGRTASSSDHESHLICIYLCKTRSAISFRFSAAEDEEDSRRSLMRRTTIGNGALEDAAISEMQFSLRIFEELLEVDYLPRSCSRAMKAVGVVEATCEEIFELLMSMDGTRYEWDCSFQFGSLVEEVDGHTAVLYHRLLLDWFPMIVWPRDLCYVRYWRRNDDGSYGGGYNISPLKPRNGRPRTQVQHLIQIDLKGWGAGYLPAFQQHCLLQMLNSVAGLREWFSQTDERGVHTRIPVMVNMASSSLSLTKSGKSLHKSAFSLDQTNSVNRNSLLMDEDSDDDDEFQIAESEQEHPKLNRHSCVLFQPETSKPETDVKRPEEEPAHNIDLSCFSGNLKRNENENARNCWRISDGNNFKVRGKNFGQEKRKPTNFCFCPFNTIRKIPAGKHLMDLVAVDWFKDSKRIDHVARRKGCAAQVAAEKGLFSMVVNVQVPGSTHYSMVFYFVMKELVPGSLLQRFVDGDDEFRNSRLKLIPLVPKIDVDIGSSTVANGVLGLVIGVITSLVVEMAFLVQANTAEEQPERLIGAVRVSHIELSSAIVPNLESE